METKVKKNTKAVCNQQVTTRKSKAAIAMEELRNNPLLQVVCQ
jgi:hypothetical protein